MLDFLTIAQQSTKRGVVEIVPKFIIKKSSDLMIRGGDFYAIWVEEKGLWSTDEDDAVRLIDRELERYYKENKSKIDSHIIVKYMWDASSGSIDAFHKYCQKQMRANHEPLDSQLIFANQETSKKDYASRKLSYPLEEGSIAAYDKLMSSLYSEEERHKIEWSIGAIVTGDSRNLEKFLVLYGAPGTGKGTIIKLIHKLFEEYVSVFNAKALGSSTNQFALQAFRSNPLVAIQYDGDLSKIDDNTNLNSIVSHESMEVNEKHKASYTASFNCFLIMGTNKPVKITDAQSGLIRRLIDVTPKGNKIPFKEYQKLMKQVGFELGAIASYCKQVYLENTGAYDNYVPTKMMGATNDFYNFILDSYFVFKKEDCTSLQAAWEMYKTYCDDAKVNYPYPRRLFQEELKNYFNDFKERFTLEDGTRIRNYYKGFIADKFEYNGISEKKAEPKINTIEFNSTESIFDKKCASCFAQYGTEDGTPTKRWDDVKSTLSELDTTKLHYVRVPENHIVIDFDIPDENGKKCFEKNLEAASQWPPTYAELSKSGAGIHLHYIYTGDATKLSRVHDEHIEVKVFTGKSSLRRKLSKCNNLPIASISSGLALKGEDKMYNVEVMKSEKGLRTLIKRNLNKEIHPATKPSIDFIYKVLEDAYNSGMIYDVSDMRNNVLVFAANSTNQSEYCIKLVNNMKFKSAEQSQGVQNDDSKLIFYDVEVFPNLFLVNWKMEGEGQKVVRMINPSPTEIEELMQFRLVGFNCRRYDNHMLYARLMGYTNEQLYKLSQKIINGDRNAFFGEAYNVSYTDVYDFSSKKQSLKKWEIELGIHHQELGLPWDQPVPEELWHKVAEYCDNDVIATEAVFNHCRGDFLARQILADLAGMTVNDTTNSLSMKIIFGNNKKPQSQFNYRNLGEIVPGKKYYTFDNNFNWKEVKDPYSTYELFDDQFRPIFPGYKFEYGKSSYRGEEVSEGGYVYAEQAIFILIALLDIASMHPSTIIAEKLFGEEYTKIFQEIRDARIAIKHKDFDTARQMLSGRLAKFLVDESVAADLAQALKIVINSVYGLTFANFDNPFRDIRNKDNIVAKRGALFMVNLKHAVQERGFTVAHIKTDSIKIPNATPEIIEFVMNYGKMYGYDFEHEATYDRMCLVNDAVYIARYKDGKEAGKWTATGTQFQVPYVFKKLFSKEPIEFEDMCETKSVAKGTLYLDMNEGYPDTTEPEMVATLRRSAKKLTKREEQLLANYETCTDDELAGLIAPGHNYTFVGRVGQFCPIKEGAGGGLLYRENEGTYYSATGTKGYRWLESEMVRSLGKEADIDRSYYDALLNEAADTISQYGDLEWFISDDQTQANI